MPKPEGGKKILLDLVRDTRFLLHDVIHNLLGKELTVQIKTGFCQILIEFKIWSRAVIHPQRDGWLTEVRHLVIFNWALLFLLVFTLTIVI